MSIDCGSYRVMRMESDKKYFFLKYPDVPKNTLILQKAPCKSAAERNTARNCFIFHCVYREPNTFYLRSLLLVILHTQC